MDPFWGGGHGPPMQVLFGENICENERIGSCRGCAPENFVCRSANDNLTFKGFRLDIESCRSSWKPFTDKLYFR